MWAAIFLVGFILCLAGIFYLFIQMYRVGIDLSLKGRRAAMLFAAGTVGALFLLLFLTLGAVNAAICVVHLVVFWILCNLIGRIVKRAAKKRVRPRLIGLAAVVLTFLWLAGGWYAAHHVSRTAYTLETDKEIGAMRIVQITDSHIGTTFHAEGFAKYLDEIAAQKPDIVVITGDFVDDSTSREDMLAACAALSKLNPTFGCYFVYGNHDKGYSSDESQGWTAAELEKSLTDSGVTVLEDESVRIGNLRIIGRKDKSEVQRSGGRAAIADLMEGVEPGEYAVVLDHQPSDYDAESEAKADLVLSGHTHGGQMFPVNRAGEWIGVNCRTYGYERRGDTDFIVSSGISCWEILFKTGCKSEYVVIDVVGKNAKS